MCGEFSISAPTNIDCKGYGKIYKAVMRNRQLPLLAKAIYAYFCSYAGNGYKAFPKRDKIVKDLQMNKDTFTKHLSRLVEDGYIAKERTPNGNIYTIVQTVKACASCNDDAGDTVTDMLVMENVAAKGFGTVPKLVMLDKTLTAQAKAIYAYFASFSGVGNTAFPRRTTVMRELGIGSSNTYYKHLELLVERGYLTITQRKTEGRFDVCIYKLNSFAEHAAPTQREPADISEKVRHGLQGTSMQKNSFSGPLRGSMSEKVQHSGKLSDTPAATSENVMSEKARHEKSVYQDFGQPNINNSSNSNNGA